MNKQVKYLEMEDFVAMIPIGVVLNVNEMSKTVDSFNRGEISLTEVKAFIVNGKRMTIDEFLKRS